MTRMSLFLGGPVTLAVAASASAQYSITGPSSSATPYVVQTPGALRSDVYSILTVGDSVNLRPDGTPYAFIGIPDGMGAWDNGDGTMTVLVAHELGATSGGSRQRAHQPKGFANGAFNSVWIVSTEPGPDFLRVLNGEDHMTSVQTSTNGSGGSLYNFARFCSADLCELSAVRNSATGLGADQRIFMQGEESGSNGRIIATGATERIGYELPWGNLLFGAWENVVARPLESDETVVIALSDGAANRVFVYRGTKQTTGNVMERAGLMNGIGYGIQVQVDGVDIANESRDFCFGNKTPAYTGTFTLVEGANGTSFLRPEDGAWDPANPTDFYFVTTDRMDLTVYGGTQVGRSRLFRLRFNDVNDVLAGGTIEAVLDGTEVMQMGDNLAVYNDIQGGTRVLIQEDPGNQAHTAKHLLYTAATDSLEVILGMDVARFGDIGVSATAPFNRDEEVTGVIDVRDILGMGWFLGAVQAHYNISGELVQGGQMFAFYAPEAVGSCMADIAQPLDGQIGSADLAALLANWGNAGVSDLNRDGVTDPADLLTLLAAWGTCGQ